MLWNRPSPYRRSAGYLMAGLLVLTSLGIGQLTSSTSAARDIPSEPPTAAVEDVTRGRSADVLGAALSRPAADAAEVAVAHAAGESHSRSAEAVPGRCRATASCVSVDGSRTTGPARMRAQGFLHGITSSTDATRVSALRPQHWRLSEMRVYDLAKKYGVGVTWIISDSWYQKNYAKERGEVIPPWENWLRYEAFVRDLVRRSVESGRRVDYWDVINEPGTPQTGDGNVALYLEQFRRAHDAIRSVDPNAKIVGPSIGTFADEPYPVTGYRNSQRDIDLQTFVDYVDRFALRFDALSWHEHTSSQREANPLRSPEDLVAHVARARKLIAATSMSRAMEIHINEYTQWESRDIPGWSAGMIGALEEANVDVSMRACALERDDGSKPYSSCAVGALDGLLAKDERSTRPVFWVYRAYADMTGHRIPATAGARISGYATRDDGRREVRVLLGRHERCSEANSPDCRGVRDAAPADVDVEIRSPYRDQPVHVTLEQIPYGSGALRQPRALFSVDVEPSEWVSVRLDGTRDGDAFTIRLRPS